MAVEAGAKTGIFEVDDVAMEYLKEHGREPKAVYHSDPDAHYVREYTFDLSSTSKIPVLAPASTAILQIQASWYLS